MALEGMIEPQVEAVEEVEAAVEEAEAAVVEAEEAVDFRLQLIKSMDTDNIEGIPIPQLFNLFEAAHNLKISNVMDLTCQILANKLEASTKEKIFRDFGIPYIKLDPEKRDYIWPKLYPGFYTGSGVRSAGTIEPGRFMRNSLFVNVKFSPFVAQNLPFDDTKGDILVRSHIETIMAMEPRYLDQHLRQRLLSCTVNLKSCLDDDQRLADLLTSSVTRHLAHILQNTYHLNIRIAVASLLSYAKFGVCREVILQDVIPVFVEELLSSVHIPLAKMGWTALTRVSMIQDNEHQLPSFYPECKEVMILKGAFDTLLRIVNQDNRLRAFTNVIAKFLAVFCCGKVLYPDQEEIIMVAVKRIYEQNMQGRFFHIVLANQALTCLYFTRSVSIEEAVIDQLIRFMVHADIAVAGSALGVVQVIVGKRGPRENEKKNELLKNGEFLPNLGRVLCHESKKFRMVACQIITDIAAEMQSYVQIMGARARLIESLSKLIREDEYDVKMEAVRAMFYVIVGTISFDIYWSDGWSDASDDSSSD